MKNVFYCISCFTNINNFFTNIIKTLFIISTILEISEFLGKIKWRKQFKHLLLLRKFIYMCNKALILEFILKISWLLVS